MKKATGNSRKNSSRKLYTRGILTDYVVLTTASVLKNIRWLMQKYNENKCSLYKSDLSDLKKDLFPIQCNDWAAFMRFLLYSSTSLNELILVSTMLSILTVTCISFKT